jgi:hypothetical protein
MLRLNSITTAHVIMAILPVVVTLCHGTVTVMFMCNTLWNVLFNPAVMIVFCLAKAKSKLF